LTFATCGSRTRKRDHQDWNAPCIAFVAGCKDAAEKDMKIYLLMMLIGALLAATHFTSAREPGTKSLPQ